MIAVSGVSMRYGSKVLFDDVTTTFSNGRRYGLTGPNGAGKSTFMKLLTGELPPQRGTVTRPERLGVLRQDQYRVRRVPRRRHGDHGQRAAVGRARRNATRSTRRPRSATPTACVSASSKAPSASTTATRPRATRRCCWPASTSPMRCTSGRCRNCRAARRCACCWPRRSSAIRRRCCSTSRPTTSTSTRSTGCASSSCATTARSSSSRTTGTS